MLGDIPANAILQRYRACERVPLRVSQFSSELKQRHMYRVAPIYAVTAWFVLQVAGLVLDCFAAPGWSMP